MHALQVSWLIPPPYSVPRDCSEGVMVIQRGGTRCMTCMSTAWDFRLFFGKSSCFVETCGKFGFVACERFCIIACVQHKYTPCAPNAVTFFLLARTQSACSAERTALVLISAGVEKICKKTRRKLPVFFSFFLILWERSFFARRKNALKIFCSTMKATLLPTLPVPSPLSTRTWEQHILFGEAYIHIYRYEYMCINVNICAHLHMFICMYTYKRMCSLLDWSLTTTTYSFNNTTTTYSFYRGTYTYIYTHMYM